MNRVNASKEVIEWMCKSLARDNCLYQDDVVDHILQLGHPELLRENSDGNVVLHGGLLKEFRTKTCSDVVWVKPDKYWRFRVPEDDTGRDARG